jgi:hypothetical protein
VPNGDLSGTDRHLRATDNRFSAYNVLVGPKTVVVSTELGHGADRDPAYRRDGRICEMAARAGSAVVDRG